MKLKEYIEHLKTLPQDLSVMELSDEFGAYSEKDKLPRVIAIVKSGSTSSHEEEWIEYEDFDADYEIYERRQVIAI